MPRMRRGKPEPEEDWSWLYQTLGTEPPADAPPAPAGRPRGRGDPALRHKRVRAGGRVEEELEVQCPWCGKMLKGPRKGQYLPPHQTGVSHVHCTTAGPGERPCDIEAEERFHRQHERIVAERLGADVDRLPPPIVSKWERRQQQEATHATGETDTAGA